MYIKDNNEWSKDTPENTKLKKMITIVANKIITLFHYGERNILNVKIGIIQSMISV